MALINCPECNRQISDMATSCPQCAFPIYKPINSGQKRPVVIEETGKQWKALQMLGVVGLCISVVSCIAMAGSEDISVLPGLLFFGSFGLYVTGRFGAWWNHR